MGKFHLLIKSYLYGRFQGVLTDITIVRDKGSHSNWEEVKNGVPRGSILGPLLSPFYINDLPQIATEDTNIFCLLMIQA